MNNNNSSLKLVHLALMLLTIVWCFVSFSSYNNSVFGIVDNTIKVFALLAGIVYLTMGYKKNANLYYKIFVGLYMVSMASDIVGSIRQSSASIPLMACQILSLIALVVLTTVKDLGREKTTLTYALLLLCQLIALFSVIFNVRSMANAVSPFFNIYVSNLLLAGTLGLMIGAKYMDKEARGRD